MKGDEIDTMARDFIPDDRIDAEIERLNNSEAVKLARREQRINYRKRQYLYQLRWFEKRGMELMENGVTMETLEAMMAETEADISPSHERIG